MMANIEAKTCSWYFMYHLSYIQRWMFVCLYLIQIHISEPIGTKLRTHLPSGLAETVEYVWAHNISPFPTFPTYFVGSGCRSMRSRWLLAPHYPANALYPWCGVCWCDITHGGLCNENAKKWTECVCVKMETWWDGKEVANELNLQLHCIYTNDNVKPI